MLSSWSSLASSTMALGLKLPNEFSVSCLCLLFRLFWTPSEYALSISSFSRSRNRVRLLGMVTTLLSWRWRVGDDPADPGNTGPLG